MNAALRSALRLDPLRFHVLHEAMQYPDAIGHSPRLIYTHAATADDEFEAAVAADAAEYPAADLRVVVVPSVFVEKRRRLAARKEDAARFDVFGDDLPF